MVELALALGVILALGAAWAHARLRSKERELQEERARLARGWARLRARVGKVRGRLRLLLRPRQKR